MILSRQNNFFAQYWTKYHSFFYTNTIWKCGWLPQENVNKINYMWTSYDTVIMFIISET